MSYQYILLDVAQKDYEDSLLWYSERSYQAAENFVKLLIMHYNSSANILTGGVTGLKISMN